MEEEKLETYVLKGEMKLPYPFTVSVFADWIKESKKPEFITTIAELRPIKVQVDNIIKNVNSFIPNDIILLSVKSFKVLSYRFIPPEAVEGGLMGGSWEYHAVIDSEALEAAVVLLLPERIEAYKIDFPVYF